MIVHRPLLVSTLPAWRDAVAERRAARLALPRSVWCIPCSDVVATVYEPRLVRWQMRQSNAGRYSLVVTEVGK